MNTSFYISYTCIFILSSQEDDEVMDLTPKFADSNIENKYSTENTQVTFNCTENTQVTFNCTENTQVTFNCTENTQVTFNCTENTQVTFFFFFFFPFH
jgi:hypothetical protein